MKPALAAVGCALLCGPAHAGVIDFESLPANYSFGDVPPGALTGLTLTDTEGVVVTISRSTGAPFDIIDLSNQPRPSHWGTKALSPYADVWAHDFIVFSLTPPAGKWVERVVIEFGDYGTDQGYVKIEGSTGPNLTGQGWIHSMKHWSGSLANEHGTLDSNVWSGNPVGSFLAMGEGFFQNSVFWDNIRFTVVPAPGAGGAVLVAALIWRHRRR